MDNIREKLVELIGDCKWYMPLDELADHLLANGVTVQEWIPVTERLPDGECLAVSMLRYQPSYNEMLIGYVAKNACYETGYCCESEGELLPNVTHWMHKPTPPKGE